MDKKLDDKLCKDFPLLFRDRHGSIYQTCMCWGLPQKGWHNIIREAAEKIEPILQQFEKDNPNLPCRVCGCLREKHYASATRKPKQCLAIHKWSTKSISVSYFTFRPNQSKIRKFINARGQKIVRIINKILRLFFYELNTCWCQEYESSAPTSSQIKEKYGTLRWYMTSYLPEIEEIISEAEKQSETTCEVCGKPGSLRTDGWLKTLCDECYAKPKESRWNSG